jgi:DNA primase
MSLPPGFLDELRTRLSLSTVVGRKVMWDNKKSNAAKGDYWAPCPFHQEKSASFHVDDRKGFYYCFGCHAKGDAISFVRETENTSFMESVEILAGEAGMQMPARDPRAKERADQHAVLAEVMEHSVQYFRLQMSTGTASSAREYLAKRNLPEAVQTRFEMGFAPNNRTSLFQHLREKGCSEVDIITSGMVIKPDDGGNPYDRFRDRIMFPIRDARGRCIAFGGRAMDPNARAKYLNSPETPLFDKGRSLYHHGPAREASGKSGRLIVAEGYMDVIALAQFGFDYAVAPLGTAVTENQLALMWRMCPEPIIALDGDKAGVRAAHRLIDIALPLLEAGKSLRFITLPEGQDPDDLLKAEGAEAFQDLLDSAQPLVTLLWDRETNGHVFDSPERRADLDKRLRSALKLIKDVSLRRHYGDAVQELRRELFKPRSGNMPFGNKPWEPSKWGAAKNPIATAATKVSLLGQNEHSKNSIRIVRESLIAAILSQSQEAALPFESELERAHFEDPICENIRLACLRSLHVEANEYEEKIIEIVGGDALENLFKRPYVKSSPALHKVSEEKRHEYAKMALAEELAKLHASKGRKTEIAEAEEDLAGLADEGVTWRLQQAADADNSAQRGAQDSTKNVPEDESELSQSLQKMLDDQIWVKKKN